LLAVESKVAGKADAVLAEFVIVVEGVFFSVGFEGGGTTEGVVEAAAFHEDQSDETEDEGDDHEDGVFTDVFEHELGRLD